MMGCDLCRPLIFRRSQCENCGGPIGSVCYPIDIISDEPDTLDALLDVLDDLDDDDLALYGLRADSTAPLDEALFAWRRAGCPR